jgi:hypothetical protein
MIKRKFPKEDLQELAKGNCKNYKILENYIMEADYWFIHWKQIFEFENKFYKTTYCQEICENKEPYVNEPDFIECVEVSPIEKLVIVYEPTKES